MKPTAWIIYPRYVAGHSDNAFAWLAGEAGKAGIELRVMFSEDVVLESGGGQLFHRGVASEFPRLVIMRDYEYVLSRRFEAGGVPVINSTESMALCKNKMLTCDVLAAAGVPVPQTIYVPGGDYDFGHAAALFGSGRFVVKQTDGAKGENVFLVTTPEELRKAVASCGGNAICQRFVESSFGRDVRVWTVGGKAVAAVERYSERSFISNFSHGGKVRPFALTSEAAELSERASAALGVEFAGIDLLFGDNGLIVNEVNGNAGFRTLSSIGENDIPAHLFRYLADRYLTK